jgi:hypothetical protein
MTSIEYLFNELWDTPKDKFEWHAILDKAKEMHKQEIINAYNEGDCFPQDYYHGADYYKKNFLTKS